MITKVDWLSFSVLLPAREERTERETEGQLITALDELSPHLVDLLEVDDTWVRSNGRAPYNVHWQRPDHGVSIFYHPRLPHALIEVTGRGCERLIAFEYMGAMVEATQTRVTRIDIACDMLTETRPTAFCEQRDTGRFKSHGIQVSESGETIYIGSRTSNRYARVYRYNPPHERAHLLRVEYVIKAEDAKLMATALLTENLASISAALGVRFGWQHPDWQPDAQDEIELKAWRPERREGKTLFWLSDTIAPLLVRLHQQGITDVRAWFEREVLTRLDPDDFTPSSISNQ